MCGVAGFTRFKRSIGTIETLKAMGDAIYHRGPDAGGEYIDDQVGLAHRRLSIIDLSDAGSQPMYSADQQLVIVFNGEIYNFPELRDELSKDGVVFQSHTDTEVILALYQKMGVSCLEKLNGMFAFALWDKQKQQLFVARDRMGKKPLYYFNKDGEFAFASEIKALLVLPDIPKEIRIDAVYDFFAYQYIPDPKSIFKDIHKLPPGHYLTINENGLRMEQYWDVSFSHTSDQEESEASAELLELVKDCTKRRMISDVPLGAFLSGGIDSSAIVAIMAMQDNDSPVKTCTIGFDDKKYNETEFAQIVADKYKTDHHEYTVHQNVKDNLEKIARYFDEPFADPSLVPTYFVSELARKLVKVAVAGDGGDEIFAGYEKYYIDSIENRLRSKFPRWVRKKIFPFFANILAISNWSLFRKGKSLLTSLSHEPAMGFYLSNAQIEDRIWDSLVKPEIKLKLDGYHPSELTVDLYEKADGPDHLSRILYTDMKTYLPGGILVKVDRMSMANSLEVRAPLLDKDIVEFSARLPSRLKFNNGEKKFILKQTFKKFLPADILYRKKMGFSVPLASWLRGELKLITEDYLFSKSSGIQQFFNMDTVKMYWQQHQDNKADHSTILWSMLMFQIWWYQYMDEKNTDK